VEDLKASAGTDGVVGNPEFADAKYRSMDPISLAAFTKRSLS